MIALKDAIPSDYKAIAALHADSWKKNYRRRFIDNFLDNDVDEDTGYRFGRTIFYPAFQSTGYSSM